MKTFSKDVLYDYLHNVFYVLLEHNLTQYLLLLQQRATHSHRSTTGIFILALTFTVVVRQYTLDALHLKCIQYFHFIDWSCSVSVVSNAIVTVVYRGMRVIS